MSGIEVAGVVLAVLPIAASAAKACSEGIGETKKIIGTKAHNEVKLNLFGDLYRELVLFNRHMKKVLWALPNVSQQRCLEVLASLEDWQSQSDITQALKSHLGTDFDDFEYAISQVFHWLNDILTDQYLQSQSVTKDSALLMKTLKGFVKTSNTKTTESRFRDRLYLWRKEERLKKEVKTLRRWREFLERITETTGCRHSTSAPGSGPKASSRPSCTIPQLSKALYRVLSTSWCCLPNCTGCHAAKLCLQNEADLHRREAGDSLAYKLLFSMPSQDPTLRSEQWLETAVTVHTWPRRGKVSFSAPRFQREQVQSVCSTMSKHPWKRGAKLNFDVDHFEDDLSAEIRQDRNYFTTNFKFQPTGKEVKLNDILADLGHCLNLTQRRKLALELSYGMMTLAGSPWLEDRWSKEHISFFHTQTNDICHTQPLVSSDLKHCTNPQNQLPLDVMHPLPPVLSLGILLLELETGETIESMRSDDDYVDPANQVVDDNTDFTAAIREAEKRSMLSPQYKEAVLACLNEQGWDDGQGEEPNVLQERIRKKIYEQIIQKLESDLEALTKVNP